MNSEYLSLSTNNTDWEQFFPELVLEDATTLTVNLSGVVESFLPLNLQVDWGDGNVLLFDNSLYKDYRSESIFGELLYGKFSSVFQNTYSFTYYPSRTSLYKQLTAQFFLEYSNGDRAWFVIPIKVISADYFESIYDLKLINTVVLPVTANSKRHVFTTAKDGYVIESHN